MNSSDPVAFKWVIRLGFWLPFAIGALIIWGFYSWRVASFPHTVATIEETWTERVKIRRCHGRGAFICNALSEPRYKTITMGRISFVRTHAGKSYSCDFTLWLGEPKDNYAPGQKLEIVPATGTCQRADVVRRLN